MFSWWRIKSQLNLHQKLLQLFAHARQFHWCLQIAKVLHMRCCFLVWPWHLFYRYKNSFGKKSSQKCFCLFPRFKRCLQGSQICLQSSRSLLFIETSLISMNSWIGKIIPMPVSLTKSHQSCDLTIIVTWVLLTLNI